MAGYCLLILFYDIFYFSTLSHLRELAGTSFGSTQWSFIENKQKALEDLM
jgi:hypothetical protein